MEPQQPPPLPPRSARTTTAQATEWRRTDPLIRVPEGFFARIIHVHNDAVSIGWYAPFVYLGVAISSTFYLLYRGVVATIDFVRNRSQN
jgi:hypothetical protein